ncbi:MAG: response regulator transcription factor [Balneolaceae bacterium]|nr:response regulator transcription factor [Balneolaceae bacterium]MBO6547263.1 response regulator transcription factor [Balneolaceae bacterium]MBO6647790.1 response regulator transcription factor [Balneolaceae bacterium]
MITCIAIDDEPNALEVVKSLAAKVEFLDLKETFSDPVKAMNYIESNPVDLLFLDINMPDISGFTFLTLIPKEVAVIFTTAYSEHAVRSYEVNAIDYLLKPFDFVRFLQAVNKVKTAHKSNYKPKTSDFIFISTGTSKQKVLISEIQFIESDGNYVYYVTEKQKIMVRASIKEVLSLLPESQFIQVQRSFVIAFRWIEKIESNHVYVAGKEIPIGKTFKDNFQSSLKKFSG